jgi:hypothetical protein
MSDTFEWQETTLPLSRTSYTTRLQAFAREEAGYFDHDLGTFVPIVERDNHVYFRATCTWYGCDAWAEVRPDALVEANNDGISGVALVAWCCGSSVSGDLIQ